MLSGAIWTVRIQDFKTILYKKTVDNKVKPLGNEKNPEKATKNSLRAYGDYVYYLPKVAESKRSSLSEEEKERCDVLVRMIPGQNTKEIIAENVDGYLVLMKLFTMPRRGRSIQPLPVRRQNFLKVDIR